MRSTVDETVEAAKTDLDLELGAEFLASCANDHQK